MRLVYSRIDPRSLGTMSFTRWLYSGIEMGRKKGADLVVLPVIRCNKKSRRLIEKKEGFLRGTLDYPDIAVLLNFVCGESGEREPLLLQEGELLQAEVMRIGSFQTWCYFFQKEAGIFKLIVLTGMPGNYRDLEYSRGAYLFLGEDQSESYLYHNYIKQRLQTAPGEVKVFDL